VVLTVTGVYQDLPKNSTFAGAAYLAPLDLLFDGESSNALNVWDNYYMNIYVQIKTNGNFDEISSLIRNATHPFIGEKTKDAKQEIFLHPMSEWHLNSEFENGTLIQSKRMMAVWSFAIIGVFVLILACINFMNLSTARSANRAKEVGIRKTIGSSRYQLIVQFYGESFLFAVLAFAFSLGLTQLLLPSFNSLSDKNIHVPGTSFNFWLSVVAFVILSTTLEEVIQRFISLLLNP
jgi:putative ABC transport system permease protein